MKVNYIELFESLAIDVGLEARTLKYCVLRLKNEGVQFLTITLPKLSKAVLKSLELGFFERPTDFAWKGKSLRYFRSFLNEIFDPSTGLVVDEVCPVAIYCIRQLCEYFYKLALPFNEELIQQYEDDFVSNEATLENLEVDNSYIEKLRKLFETNFRPISSATPSQVLKKYRPRSGPGTFSNKKGYEARTGNPFFFRKNQEISHPSSLYKGVEGFSKPYPDAPVFPEVMEDVDYSEVLFVPKDSRGPRVIVREPYLSLRYQLSFHDFLKDHLERLTRNRVNFQDQQINRDLARKASIDKEYSTIDLRSASDLVSHSIIKQIFRHSPAMRYFLRRRTQRAKLPSGKFITLHKVAGMGSGYTFPTMSLLIHLTITATLMEYTRLSWKEISDDVYVYGDDIIVKTKYINHVYKALQKVGLQVNESKSFHRSSFRESCGGDYYRGNDVAPVRLKLSGSNLEIDKDSPSFNIQGKLGLINLERHCRVLVKNGLLKVSEVLYKAIEKSYGKLPRVSGESPVIGRYQLVAPDYSVYQEESGLYKTIKCLVPVPALRKAEVNPYIKLADFFARDQRQKTFALNVSTSGSLPDGFVAEPWTIKYRRIRTSYFRLMA